MFKASTSKKQNFKKHFLLVCSFMLGFVINSNFQAHNKCVKHIRFAHWTAAHQRVSRLRRRYAVRLSRLEFFVSGKMPKCSKVVCW
jgi:hypothetical protein